MEFPECIVAFIQNIYITRTKLHLLHSKLHLPFKKFNFLLRRRQVGIIPLELDKLWKQNIAVVAPDVPEYHQKRYTGGYKDLFLQNTILQGIILPLNVVFSLPPALVISKKPPNFEENCKRCFIGFGLVLCFDLVLQGGSSDMRQ